MTNPTPSFNKRNRLLGTPLEAIRAWQNGNTKRAFRQLRVMMIRNPRWYMVFMAAEPPHDMVKAMTKVIRNRVTHQWETVLKNPFSIGEKDEGK